MPLDPGHYRGHMTLPTNFTVLTVQIFHNFRNLSLYASGCNNGVNTEVTRPLLIRLSVNFLHKNNTGNFISAEMWPLYLDFCDFFLGQFSDHTLFSAWEPCFISVMNSECQKVHLYLVFVLLDVQHHCWHLSQVCFCIHLLDTMQTYWITSCISPYFIKVNVLGLLTME